MKNLIFLTTLGVLLLTGCSKEEIEDQTTDQSYDTVYVLKQSNTGDSILESTTLVSVQSNLEAKASTAARDFGETKGYFVTAHRDFTEISWFGAQGERGVTGEAEVKISSPSIGNLHFLLKTECVTINGNEAVYGGVVTRVLLADGESIPLETGWRFYFKVVDNGRGGAGVYDQISNTMMFASARATSLCNTRATDRVLSDDGYQNVTIPGYVDVE